MEPSPLTQVSRPETFQPKILRLYETLLLRDDDDAQEDDDAHGELSDGFWEEFFLHRPDHGGLRRLLADIAPDEMLHRQARSQQLFLRAIARVKLATAPADDIALEVGPPPPAPAIAGSPAARP
jgi:hypothetical protein